MRECNNWTPLQSIAANKFVMKCYKILELGTHEQKKTHIRRRE